MWSASDKNTFLKPERFYEIIDNANDNFEVQLEGGEPLEHPDFWDLFLYAGLKNKCKKIIISSNNIVYDRNMANKIAIFSEDRKIKVEIRPSINYHLEDRNINLTEDCERFVNDLKRYKNVSVVFNVRLRKGKDEFLFGKYDFLDNAKIFYFQKYGRNEDDVDADLPFIKQNVDEFHL
jgi:MoaA/NifB/PqqE/SkfB family radical SAM enzyme